MSDTVWSDAQGASGTMEWTESRETARITESFQGGNAPSMQDPSETGGGKSIRRPLRNRRIESLLGMSGSWLSVALIMSSCLFILVYVLLEGMGVISLRFLFSEPDPSALNAQSGGILTPIIGTILLTIIGMLLAWPAALSTALFLVHDSRRGFFPDLIRVAIDILAGVPTIVVALFALALSTSSGLGFLSVSIEGADGMSRSYGRSFLVAGIAMAVMILPFVVKTAEEAIKSVPRQYYEASMALGATKWYTIRHIILKTAKPGLVTAVILGMGRIIGDTAIVLLTLGGTLRMTGLQPWWIPANWLSTLQNTGCTLTSYIHYTSPAGEGNSTDVSFGASFVLILIILLLNGIAALAGGSGKRSRQEGPIRSRSREETT